MSSFCFVPESLQDAEDHYRNVHLEDRQRELVAYLGARLAPRLGMTEVACRGYLVLAVIEWQRETHRAISELEKEPAEKRLRAAQSIAKHFRFLVARALVEPQQKAELEAAIHESLKDYIKVFVGRNTPTPP